MAIINTSLDLMQVRVTGVAVENFCVSIQTIFQYVENSPVNLLNIGILISSVLTGTVKGVWE